MAAKANVMEVWIGGVKAPVVASVEEAPLHRIGAVTGAGTGEDVVGGVVTARTEIVRLSFRELTADQLKVIRNLTGSQTTPLAVGAEPPYTSLRLHDPQDGDGSVVDNQDLDVSYPAGYFQNFRATRTGQGIKEWSVEFQPVVSAGAQPWVIGPMPS